MASCYATSISLRGAAGVGPLALEGDTMACMTSSLNTPLVTELGSWCDIPVQMVKDSHQRIFFISPKLGLQSFLVPRSRLWYLLSRVANGS